MVNLETNCYCGKKVFKYFQMSAVGVKRFLKKFRDDYCRVHNKSRSRDRLGRKPKGHHSDGVFERGRRFKDTFGRNWNTAEKIVKITAEHVWLLLAERSFEDHENLVEPLLAWTRDTENQILFKEWKQKYEVFKNPQVGASPNIVTLTYKYVTVRVWVMSPSPLSNSGPFIILGWGLPGSFSLSSLSLSPGRFSSGATSGFFHWCKLRDVFRSEKFDLLRLCPHCYTSDKMALGGKGRKRSGRICWYSRSIYNGSEFNVFGLLAGTNACFEGKKKKDGEIFSFLKASIMSLTSPVQTAGLGFFFVFFVFTVQRLSISLQLNFWQENFDFLSSEAVSHLKHFDTRSESLHHIWGFLFFFLFKADIDFSGRVCHFLHQVHENEMSFKQLDFENTWLSHSLALRWE